MSDEHAIHPAIAAWSAALDPSRVDASAETIARYARTMQPHGTAPRCVLYPESAADVQAIARIAQEHACPIYPISGGRNWGYGDACAPEPGAAIVDLGRMRQILEINAELGYVVIEPGVTQQQLYEAVRAAAPDYWVDITGAGPDATIAGNAVERGFGHTPYGDHVRSTCGMAVVLPDGRLLETGFGHYPGAKTKHVYPYGVGPILDGLFLQSNLGIVVRMGVWLYPRPEAFSFFLIRVPRDEDLAEAVDRLRPLRMHGILNSAVHLGNDLRVFTSMDRYPWERAGGETPLPPALREELRAETRLGAWNITGSLSGTPAQVRDARRRLRRAFRGLGRTMFVNDRKLALGKWVCGWLNRAGLGRTLKKHLDALDPNYGLLKGIPTDMPLQSLGWRLRDAEPERIVDPLETSAGLIWLAPVLPLCGAGARQLLDAVEPVFHAHGFDLPVTFTLLNERAMVAVLNVSFDRSAPGEGERAAACYEEAASAAMALGFIPYRSSPQGMAKLALPGDVFWEVAGEIKHTLDPGGVLAPGRYIPTRPR
ncbi:MAG: FAD-binding oxidoreductase [Candidatus Hydrogenedentes bacterium]|nr:FAD-binding oxidoreductase [Candidatus Hydrogenedentota bacterium]